MVVEDIAKAIKLLVKLNENKYYRKYLDWKLRMRIRDDLFDEEVNRVLGFLSSDYFIELNKDLSFKEIKSSLRIYAFGRVTSTENTLPHLIEWSIDRWWSRRKKGGLNRALLKSRTDEDFIGRLRNIQKRKIIRIINEILENARIIMENPYDDRLRFTEWDEWKQIIENGQRKDRINT